MRTKVTKKWLESQEPCSDGLEYWVKKEKTDLFDFVRQCIKDDHCDWVNWLMVRCMDRKQYMRYALYAVKQVESIYQKQDPESTLVTDVIRAVKACIRDDSKENREAADSAHDAATASAVYAAVNVVAAYAVYSTVNVSAAAAAYAIAAACDSPHHKEAYKTMYIKLLRYGMRIMKEKQK